MKREEAQNVEYKDSWYDKYCTDRRLGDAAFFKVFALEELPAEEENEP